MPQKRVSSLNLDGEPEEDEYEVEDIIDFRSFRGHPKFLVKWKGFPPEDNTWEPEGNMTNLPAFAQKMAAMKEAYLNSKGTKRQKRGTTETSTSGDTSVPLEMSMGSRKAIKDLLEINEQTLANDSKSVTTTHPEEAVEVEDLLDYKPRFKKDYFLVRWKGDWEDSWEPRKNLLIVGDLMTKMIDLKMSYLRIYGPNDMEEDVFVTVQSIRISGTATLSAVVVEMTRDTERRTLLPLQEVRQRWPQQLLDFLLSRLRLRTTSEGEPADNNNKVAGGPHIASLR